MKFAIVAILCVALIDSKVILPKRSLGAIFEQFSDENSAEVYANINNDIQEFLDLLPKNEIEAHIRNYVQNDAEVKSNWAYATSDAVKQQVFGIENGPEVNRLRSQLEAGGLDVARFVNLVHDIFDYEHMSRSMRVGGGLRGLLAEIKPTIPMTRIKLLAAKKYLLSSAFRKMVKIILSAEFRSNVEAIFKSAGFVALEADARANGVDVDALYEFASGVVYKYKAVSVEDYE